MNVLAAQRHSAIVAEVERSGAVRVSDLVRHLGVSDMTIRRDISNLAERGLIRRVHGGAVSVSHARDEPGFTAKSTMQRAEKLAIAARAAHLVSPGDTIGISAGTTTYELAVTLQHVPDLTVVTNSIPVAQFLHESPAPGARVVLTGGVRTPSDALVGPVAVNALRSLHVDQLFIGAHGIEVGPGLTTPNLDEAETNRALVASARRVVVLADHTKLGIIGLSSFLELDKVDELIADAGLPGRRQAELAALVDILTIARPLPA